MGLHQIDGDEYDKAAIRLSLATDTLFCITCAITGGEVPSHDIIANAMRAAATLIEDAQEALDRGMNMGGPAKAPI